MGCAWPAKQKEYLASLQRDRRRTSTLLTEKITLGTSSGGQERSGKKSGNKNRKQVTENNELLENEEIENDEALNDKDTGVVHAKMEDGTLFPDDYRRISVPRSEEDGRKASREEARANIVVTGGAFTFLLLAALLVTATFLMSPVIEQVFGKTQLVHSYSCSLMNGNCSCVL